MLPISEKEIENWFVTFRARGIQSEKTISPGSLVLPVDMPRRQYETCAMVGN